MDFTLRKSELFSAQQRLLGLAHFATCAFLTAAEFLAAAAGAAACLHSIVRGYGDLDAVLMNVRVRYFLQYPAWNRTGAADSALHAQAALIRPSKQYVMIPNVAGNLTLKNLYEQQADRGIHSATAY